MLSKLLYYKANHYQSAHLFKSYSNCAKLFIKNKINDN